MEFKESEKMELKKSTSELKEAVISIVAILNKHRKGEVYFGIDEKKQEVIGQNVSDATLREISRIIAEQIEPKLYPKIEKVNIEGKDCIKIDFEGKENVYYAYGRAYIRIGTENRQLSAKEIENKIVEKNEDKLRWDNAVCEEASLNDISVKKLKSFIKDAGLKYNSLKKSLENLGIFKNEKLLNSAIILFGKEPQKFFPNAKLRCAVFATADTSYLIDMQNFEGDLFYLIEKAQDYILRNVHIGMKIEGLKRIDVPEIDKEAFREAIINAFCHRDYREYDSVNIAIFKDRLEIRNPGSLYGGLTIEQIKKENISRRRNEIIAELFHRIHFVEKWGRGIQLMVRKEPTVDFKEIAGVFIAVFKRKEELIKDKEDFGGVTGGVTGGVKLLDYIKNNPGKRAIHLQKELKVAKRTLERHLKKLREGNKIEFKGSAKTGGYFIKK